MTRTNLMTKIVIIAMIIIAVITIGMYIYKQSKEENPFLYYENIDFKDEVNVYENVERKDDRITIHITGDVNYPGVVVLENGARIVDAIEAAGGETEEADLDKLNLARILNDGDKVYVPNKNDINTEEMILEDESENNKQATININTASIEELIKLPGIGEATATKIVEYRKQNGKFKTIEELKNVAGIGNNKFETIKDKIRVK